MGLIAREDADIVKGKFIIVRPSLKYHPFLPLPPVWGLGEETDDISDYVGP